MKRVSIVALGLMLFGHQTMSLQMARAAQLSLGAGSSSEMTELTAPIAEPETARLQPTTQGCEKSKPTKSSELKGKSDSPNQGNTGLNYQSSSAPGSSGQLVAQAQPPTAIDPGTAAAASGEDDCCEVSGNSLCEVAGVPPVGGGGLLASPLLALAALPLAAIPFIPSGRSGGSESTPPPVVPEPSSTAGLVAGFGVVGLLLSRRRLQRSNKSNR